MPLTFNANDYNNIRQVASVTEGAYPDSLLSSEIYAGSAIITVFALAGISPNEYDGLEKDKQTHLRVAAIYIVVQLILPQIETVTERRAGAYAVKVASSSNDKALEFQRIVEANIQLFRGIPPTALLPPTTDPDDPDKSDAVPYAFAEQN